MVTYGLSTRPFTDFERPPVLWSEERTEALTNLTFSCHREAYSVLLSQIHRSLCLIARQRSLQNHTPSTDHLGLTCRVPPNEVVAMSGIYVDDFLTAGPSPVVRSFLAILRKMWETSDPQYLTMDAELPFLGVSIRMTKDGLLLHQHHYTLDFLREHSSHVSARKRTTSAEPEHFRRETPLPPDSTNIEHQQWVKIGQKIVGGSYGSLLALVQTFLTLFRPLPQILTKDIKGLKVTLRHLLQYINTTQTLGLLYPYPRHREMTDFTVYSDALLCTLWETLPVWVHNPSLFGHTCHLIHWQSVRETKISESSAEAELHALANCPENQLATFGFSFTNPLLPPWSCHCDATTQQPSQ